MYSSNMMLIQILLIFISKYLVEIVKSESTSGICKGKMQMVKSKNIAEEILETRVGITNGEPFLTDYLNKTRFVLDVHLNCPTACFR